MDERDLIKSHMESVGHNLDSWEGVRGVIIHNLGNFAYRYISTARDPAPSALPLSESAFSCTSLEDNLLLGLKLGPVELRSKLIEMAKRVGKEATIGQRLRIEILNYRAHGAVELLIEAAISWDHPKHSFDEQVKVFELKKTYSDAMELRNKLPLALEEVCAFF